MSSKRLPHIGRIDRNQKINFTWDGKQLSGFAGDTLASALLANGETTLSRSFKYHRPRGVTSAGVEESGALVAIGKDAHSDPNVRATTQELYEGLEASGQNAWPNVRFDFNAINGLFSRFLSAGFYYKTFMGIPPFEWGKGTGIWMKYEKIIRKAAGMGVASRAPDPDVYDHAHTYCDILVVGSGPAGLAAAATAASEGLDVLLVEQDSEFGGDYLNSSDKKSETQRKKIIKEITQAGGRMMSRTTAFGLYDFCTAGLHERVSDHLANPDKDLPRHRSWTVRAKQIILATGAIERIVAFGNNDRPGVMTVDAARSYLNRYGILSGSNIIIATNNDSVYQTAVELAQAGAQVNILDNRAQISPELMGLISENDISLRTKSAPLRVLGGQKIKGLEVANKTQQGWIEHGTEVCDCVLISGGWSPVVNLLSHRGVKPVWNAELACFVAPSKFDEPIILAGACDAIWQTKDCIKSGKSAASKALKALGVDIKTKPNASMGGWQTPIAPLYEVKTVDNKAKAKSFVDLQHDVKTDDIRLAHQEGFVSVEHLKRYTTLGMANDGGKVGNIIGLALMAECRGMEIPDVGTTTFRPPYTPVAIGALKGRNVDEHFRPLRITPMHDWNIQHGATMTMAGLWHRPWYFAREGEGISEAYIRETTTVRNAIGLCDVTSLGKIAIQGPDATELLNRIYINPFAKLPIGKARYGIMLRDDGIVMDDGTTWRLSETEYFMTTTTANAGKVMVFLEELLQTRWQDLRVHVTSVSEQWAGCAVAGPKSREVLEDCLEDATVVSNEAFPFMGVINTTLKGGIPCRIARISFSGERAYETYVPSDYANTMMDLLWESAQKFDGCLYGTEALGALRIEKGHVTAAEIDGRVTVDDLGLGKMASNTKSYIGSTLRKRPELEREDRPQLVGIKPKNIKETFNAGSILCAENSVAGLGDGWITAVTHSPVMGHWVGLGYISSGYQAWEGKTVIAADPVRKGNIEVEIISPHMYDSSGERMHG